MRTKLETKRVKTVTSLLSWMGGWDGWYRRRSVLLTATHHPPSTQYSIPRVVEFITPESRNDKNLSAACCWVYVSHLSKCMKWNIKTFIYLTLFSFFLFHYSFEKGLLCQAHACMYNRGFTKFGIKVAWSLQFLGYLRTLSLKFQKAWTNIEVFLPGCLS